MDYRLPIPLAYADPAFLACIAGAAENPELIANFERLYGVKLLPNGSPMDRLVDAACGVADDAMSKFVNFVHDGIYLRLPDEAIDAFRLAALVAPKA